MTTDKTRPIAVRLPVEVVDRLTREAEARGVPMGTYVRKLLEAVEGGPVGGVDIDWEHS